MIIQAKSFQIAQLQAKIDRLVGRAPADSAKPPRRVLAIRSEHAGFLKNGLPSGCVHEFEGASWDAEAGVAASGFAAALLSRTADGAILWAVRDDTPFSPRLAAFGLEPDRVIFCRCRNDGEALAALEDALRTKGITAALGEVEQVTLTQSRRLHLICEATGNTGLLLRRQFHGRRSGRKLQGSAAVTRWRIQLAPTEAAEAELGPPRWRLDLLYRRGGMPASFLVEWNDEARHLRLVAELADHETEPHQSELRRAG
jgi:protein ImuA